MPEGLAGRSGFFVVVNPAAGNGRAARRAVRALERLARGGQRLGPVRLTAAPGDAARLARDAYRDGWRSFLACGGDGTAFEVVNGFAGLSLDSQEEPCRLGILGLGTGNSFVADQRRELGKENVGQLMARRTVDLLRFEHRGAGGEEETLFALGNVSLGFPAEVAALVNRRLKGLGVLGYSLGVLIAVLGLGAIRLRIAEGERTLQEGEATFASFSNNPTFGGNLRIAPHADPSDGEGDLVWCRRVPRRTLLRAFPRVYGGRHLDHPAIESARFRSLTLSSDEDCEILIDGETIRSLPRSVSVVAAALEVVV